MSRLLLLLLLLFGSGYGITLKIYSLDITDEMLYRDIKPKFEARYPNIHLLILRNLNYFAIQKKLFKWPRDEDVVITFSKQLKGHKNEFQHITPIGYGYLAIYSNKQPPVTLQNFSNQNKVIIAANKNPAGVLTAYALYNFYKNAQTVKELYQKCPTFPYSAIDIVKMVKYQADVDAGVSWFAYSKWKRYGFFKLKAFFIPPQYYKPPVLIVAINPNPDAMLVNKLTIQQRTAKFEAAKTFIQFLTSQEGQKILRKWGF